jgi:hypothetical protein
MSLSLAFPPQGDLVPHQLTRPITTLKTNTQREIPGGPGAGRSAVRRLFNPLRRRPHRRACVSPKLPDLSTVVAVVGAQGAFYTLPHPRTACYANTRTQRRDREGSFFFNKMIVFERGRGAGCWSPKRCACDKGHNKRGEDTTNAISLCRGGGRGECVSNATSARAPHAEGAEEVWVDVASPPRGERARVRALSRLKTKATRARGSFFLIESKKAGKGSTAMHLSGWGQGSKTVAEAMIKQNKQCCRGSGEGSNTLVGGRGVFKGVSRGEAKQRERAIFLTRATAAVVAMLGHTHGNKGARGK